MNLFLWPGLVLAVRQKHGLEDALGDHLDHLVKDLHEEIGQLTMPMFQIRYKPSEKVDVLKMMSLVPPWGGICW